MIKMKWLVVYDCPSKLEMTAGIQRLGPKFILVIQNLSHNPTRVSGRRPNIFSMCQILEGMHEDEGLKKWRPVKAGT